jgi:PIN domain nuclease of toxin-antitoxin system
LRSLLLDTHVLIWWRGDYKRISRSGIGAIEDADAACFSAVSIWEIAVKHALGKLRMPSHLVDTLEQRGFSELPVRSRHALAAGALPKHHGDPFDRMLVAQAQAEGMTLVTNDSRIAAYDVPVLW